jgi:hypothetical protein
MVSLNRLSVIGSLAEPSCRDAKAAFHAAWVQVNPQNRQTGAVITANGVIRSGRGDALPLRTRSERIPARTRFTYSPLT